VALVARIIENVGFKTELGQGGVPVVFPELACVQDADRMDAIGAIGIARTFTYGGTKNRPLYDPAVPYIENISKEAYMAQQGANPPTINHFYEKLLRLKDMMKTDSGKAMAEQRHAFMETFLQQFYDEHDGKK
jgi:uncharacterized protein